jgi:hypothetical protein
MAAAIDRRLQALDALGDNQRLVLLAGALPVPAARAALLRTLQRHWDEGPNGLKWFQAAAGPALDPGFLVLLKMLPRKEIGVQAAVKDARARDAKRAGAGGKSVKLVELKKSRQQQELTSQQWFDFSLDVLKSFCKRFYAATQARRRAGARESPADDAQFPVKLHPEGDLVAVYRLDWPDQLGSRMADAPALRVRYARIQQKMRPDLLLSYYRRQLPDCEEHVGPEGAWLDGLAVDKEQFGACSVDVFLTRSRIDASCPATQEQELTIHVLVIRCDGVLKRPTLSASR